MRWEPCARCGGSGTEIAGPLPANMNYCGANGLPYPTQICGGCGGAKGWLVPVTVVPIPVIVVPIQGQSLAMV